MTREELTTKFLESSSNNCVLQLATGYGKTLCALRKIEQWYNDNCKILVVIPYNSLISNWKAEIIKWKYNEFLDKITFSTYVSLPKHCASKWDICILDEAHHTSERCREAMYYLHTKHLIALSATLKRDLLSYFKYAWKAEIFKVDIKDAIESDVLPEPKILLIPLSLETKTSSQVIKKNAKRTDALPMTINYTDKWKYRSYTGPINIRCTQQQYYDDLSNLIEWYKQKSKGSAVMKNMWLHKAGERLKWLAKQKEELIRNLLKLLKNRRVLAFCQSIEQSEKLGCPCVHSKVGLANLELFNSKKIKHISAVNMLDEGQNLTDCQVGIFQMINSSQRVITQRIGRELRHKNPILIFPYYINTREEEIINEIIKDYNPYLITKIQCVDDIKNYL